VTYFSRGVWNHPGFVDVYFVVQTVTLRAEDGYEVLDGGWYRRPYGKAPGFMMAIDTIKVSPTQKESWSRVR
jgi:hypothetical protein